MKRLKGYEGKPLDGGLSPQEQREKDIKRRKRQRNRPYAIVAGFFALLFVSLIGYLIYFQAAVSRDFINSPYNTRQDTFADRVVRGDIVSADGQKLAYTEVYEDGSEDRVYPYSNMFAHVVGYDSNGKSGLESEANFLLLTSHQFFVDQMKNEYHDTRNMGDTVITSLNAALQQTAYYALGDRRGAVIAIEPDTGRILCMVSKPDFDPNHLAENWSYIIADENDSSLLNRATNGAYPPGSTFKLVTALDYYRKNKSFDGYSYLCAGTITQAGHTIHCYDEISHGQENLYSAFANSCNCAFADIGTALGGGSLRSTAEDLLFNKELPLTTYKRSIFSVDKSSPVPLVMQTAIGQGNTLVSPAHMCLLACAVANDGVLMNTTLIDEVRSCDGDNVKTTRPSEYRRLMSTEEAEALSHLMEEVVSTGTASALSGREYQAAGKTGSAEFNEEGASHSWFMGYASAGDRRIALAVIVENGGTGSESAVPLAGEVLDEWYYGSAFAAPEEEEAEEEEWISYGEEEEWISYGEEEEWEYY